MHEIAASPPAYASLALDCEHASLVVVVAVDSVSLLQFPQQFWQTAQPKLRQSWQTAGVAAVVVAVVAAACGGPCPLLLAPFWLLQPRSLSL
jgi:hypothetical protein